MKYKLNATATPVSLTPMMARYKRIKTQIPRDALLVFRLGDFYEFFFEDAEIAAKALRIALTKRGTTPMCGVPYHAKDSYWKKLLEAGHKIAICEEADEVIYL